MRIRHSPKQDDASFTLLGTIYAKSLTLAQHLSLGTLPQPVTIRLLSTNCTKTSTLAQHLFTRYLTTTSRVLSRQDILLPVIYLEVGLLQVLFSLSFTSINQLTSFHGLMPSHRDLQAPVYSP
jgi:hypothetical protein